MNTCQKILDGRSFELEFVVPGRVVPKARPRFGRGRAYTPRCTSAYEQLVAAYAIEARQRCGMDIFCGDVAVEIEINSPRKADIDNVVKVVLDALTGVVYEDDRQVCAIAAHFTGDGAGYPGIRVKVRGAHGDSERSRSDQSSCCGRDWQSDG